jgi:hypothetical protein
MRRGVIAGRDEAQHESPGPTVLIAWFVLLLARLKASPSFDREERDHEKGSYPFFA